MTQTRTYAQLSDRELEAELRRARRSKAVWLLARERDEIMEQNPEIQAMDALMIHNAELSIQNILREQVFRLASGKTRP
jgi:hypothetical protein